MSTDIKVPSEQTTSALVSDLFDDFKHLVELQFQLTRREIKVELRKRASAAVVCALGVGMLFLAAIVGCLTVVHLLHWVALPPRADLAWLPLWASYAVVTAVIAVSGGILALVGRVRFRSITSYQRVTTE